MVQDLRRVPAFVGEENEDSINAFCLRTQCVLFTYSMRFVYVLNTVFFTYPMRLVYVLSAFCLRTQRVLFTYSLRFVYVLNAF